MIQSSTFLIAFSYSQGDPQKERIIKKRKEKTRGKEKTNTTTFDLVLRQFGIDTKEFPAGSTSHFSRFPRGMKQ